MVRIASAVAASALLVGALSACGSSAKKSADAVPGAAGAANSAGAAAAGGGVGAKADLLAAAAVMQKAASAKIAVSTAGDKSDQGSGLYSWGAQPELDLSEQQSGQAMKVRMVDNVMYLGVDDQQAAQLGGKHWLKLDGNGPAGSLNGNFQALAMMINPSVQLAAAAQAGQLSTIGSESVGGVSTKHFQSVMPTATLVAAVPNLQDSDRKAVLAALGQGGSTITSDFWLNAQHQLVQQKVVGSNGSSASPAAGAINATTTQYSDFGVKVSVTAPPASDQVAPADSLKLLGAMGGVRQG
ncbi:hypothetical protein P3T36_005939 [Kitasatospora sp. MAP12-15]|uniref:hypothetical protein n=1 Tax=unclassified Kitasatospora TaxID=2633591 RepID=UPI00247312EE|nr:hypothetical protein [Kitasatospora sp. MAP12-44]MDH6111035.1 hypothetical protein [Kitasatospora sp. MAP12-44]